MITYVRNGTEVLSLTKNTTTGSGGDDTGIFRIFQVYQDAIKSII